jgi:hypothetical protein
MAEKLLVAGAGIAGLGVALAFTAIDRMCDADLMKSATSDFAATAELSRNAVAKIREHAHVHGGCGCA